MNFRDPRLVLVGDGPTALSALIGLSSEYSVVGVVRNSDGGASDPVVARAISQGCVVAQAPTLLDLEEFLSRMDPDLVVISSYSRILPAALLERFAIVNVHYSPLPEYRGRANVNWAIINGDSEAAITVHSVVPGLDSGPILAQQRVAIGLRDTVSDLYERLNSLQETILPEAVARRLGGDIGDPQDDDAASYCCGRGVEDGLIDWAQSAQDIDRLIRALTQPFPGAFTYLRGIQVRIDGASVVDPEPRYVGRVPGRVIRVDRVTGDVDVLAGTGILRISRVAVDGETRTAADVIRSTRDTLGVSIVALMTEIAALREQIGSLG